MENAHLLKTSKKKRSLTQEISNLVNYGAKIL